MKVAAITVLAAAGAALAQSSNQSLCDKYTQAIFKNTDPANELTLLTLLVNSAVIGNYSNATKGDIKPTGILTTNGNVNGTGGINLLKYFDGSLLSTNRNGKAVSVNFLDGGGAAPLMMNMPAFANATSSNQYKLLTHLYSYFGDLLGCSGVGKGSFPAYAGSTSQYQVHQFMNLSPLEVTYFIQEVAYSALSFGVTVEDVTAVGKTLGSVFNVKCGPMIPLPSDAQPAYQSLCNDPSCPTAANSTCTAANSGTNGTAPASASGSASGSGSASMPSSTGGSSGGSTGGSTMGGGAGSSKVVSGIVGGALAAAAFAAATLL